MEKNFLTEQNELFTKMGNVWNIVLSTSANNMVTSRTVSAIPADNKLYFVSVKRPGETKLNQIDTNPNIALCTGSIQITGKASIIGKPTDEKISNIMAKYREFLETSYNNFCKSPLAVVVEVELSTCKWWKNIQPADGVFIDFDKKSATALSM